ncbi:hypothetical protein CHM34_09740 [Paludifilum halophilum]|uniref:Transposase InsH N-terminal domain-containing protein n=1 Tax=Paludifilum halophilum TaxID=1642702 RepID=A0A235B622_9BACL|nr:hypothetical protein CHM34_09740 [Paludifilum halophilum]
MMKPFSWTEEIFMLGKRNPQNALFQYVNLEDLIPENHLLRRIDRVLDLSFLRPMVEPLYVSEGRPSIDPEVAFCAMLLGYLFDLNDHRLHQEMTMHAGYRWFCRLDFNDPVPDRSTLIKTRERWAKAGVLDQILAQVVQQCIDRGLVQGQTRAIDGTQIPARAAVNSLERIGTVLQMEERESKNEKDSDEDDPHPSPAGRGSELSQRTVFQCHSSLQNRPRCAPVPKRKGKGSPSQLSRPLCRRCPVRGHSRGGSHFGYWGCGNPSRTPFTRPGSTTASPAPEISRR